MLLNMVLFSSVVLEKILESPLDCNIQPVNPDGSQSWIFIERIDTEAKTLILCHLMQKTDSLELCIQVGKPFLFSIDCVYHNKLEYS